MQVLKIKQKKNQVFFTLLNCALNYFCSGLKSHTSPGCYVLQDLADRDLHTQTGMSVLTNMIKLDYFFPAKYRVWRLNLDRVVVEL